MKVETLGVRATFLVPSVKIHGRKYSKHGPSIAKRIHEFLNEKFGGYTCVIGNIYGYFTMEEYLEYDELREFRVAFRAPHGTKMLDRYDPLGLYTDDNPCVLLAEFLAKLAKDIDEECIYLEIGEKSFLIYP